MTPGEFDYAKALLKWSREYDSHSVKQNQSLLHKIQSGEWGVTDVSEVGRMKSGS